MATCKNCKHEFNNAQYCASCGQRVQTRFTVSYVWDELLSLLNLERGLVYNFFLLIKTPASSILSYIDGKTRPYYPPLAYFLAGMTIFIVLVLDNLEADGWSTGKMFIFDTGENIHQINDYYKKDKQQLASIVRFVQQDSSIQHTLQKSADGYKTPIDVYKDDELLASNFVYADAFDQLMKLDAEEKEAILIMEKKALRSQVFTYLVFYFIPLYLAALFFIFNIRSRFNFTENLIVHTFGSAQLIWMVNAFAFILWPFQYFKIAGPSIVLYLSLFGIAIALGFYLKLIKGVYQQNWIVTILKSLAIVVIIFYMTLGLIMLGNFFITGESHL